MMSDMSDDLEGHYSVQRSRVINHPQYANPVLVTQYGWAKRNHQTVWLKELHITEIVENTNDKLGKLSPQQMEE
jgi:hypothetical protein